jgi:cytochrome c556
MRTQYLAALAAAVIALPAAAQFAKPEDAVKYRQAAFTVMGNHMGRLYRVVQGRVPYERDAVVRSAEIVETMALMPYEAFTPGSDLLESRAKPALWQEQAKFKQLAADMQAETVKLTAAAKTGNPDALRKQFAATAKTCDACHDVYREK